jgi:hypothetical protein
MSPVELQKRIPMIKPIFHFAAAGLLLLPWTVAAQEPSPEADLCLRTAVVLHPMPEAQPALRYPLLPPKLDQRPGNAALAYQQIEPTYPRLFSGQRFDEKISGYHELPLDELLTSRVRQDLRDYDGVIRDLQRAARYASCDWQVPLHEGIFWEHGIVEMSQMRHCIWVLAAVARLQIADGKFDDALRNLQTGYAMARHAAQGGTYVHALIGAALVGMLDQAMADWIQRPDAPNLYWNLTALPRPIIDFQPAMELERDALAFSYPDLYGSEPKKLSANRWRDRLRSLCRDMQNYCGISASDIPYGSYDPLIVGMTGYLPAKRYLLKHGWKAADVEAMPVAQAILLASVRSDEAQRDRWFKWMPLSLEEVERHVKDEPLPGDILPLARLHELEVLYAKVVESRVDREIAMFRVLEALRIYAAHHQGRLPDRLNDVTEVPIPQDPLHGRPFLYRRLDDKARLESPPPKSGEMYLGRSFLIQMAPKGK